jgi:hypothetical protein
MYRRKAHAVNDSPHDDATRNNGPSTRKNNAGFLRWSKLMISIAIAIAIVLAMLGVASIGISTDTDTDIEFILISSVNDKSPRRTSRMARFSPPDTLVQSPNNTNTQAQVVVKRNQPLAETNIRIGYAITVSHCPPPKEHPAVSDGPRVLAYSIQKAHLQSSRYPNFTLLAIVQEGSEACTNEIKQAGYEIIVHPNPINMESIPSPTYQQLIQENGCCGASEFTKLYAYTLTHYDIIVHLDNDVLLLQPLDELFNSILEHKQLELIYTRDYIQVNLNEPRNSKKLPIQGGFLVLKPNLDRFHEMRALIHTGNFTREDGWFHSKIGNFWGDSTIQGFLSYVYSELYPQYGMEVNRCIYNNLITDPPRHPDGICKDGSMKDKEDDCDDCQTMPLSQIRLLHFAACQKPWVCSWPIWRGATPPMLCQYAHQAWFRMRHELELQEGLTSKTTLSKNDTIQGWDITLGYCTKYPCKFPQPRRYIPLL